MLAASEARAQSGLRMVVGGLELTHPYGLLMGIPLGDGPFSVEGQVGPGGAGGSLSFARGLGLPEGEDHGVSWFVSAGLGRYFKTSSPGTPVGGDLALIGGLRFIGAARNGGLTLEGGLGYYQTIATSGIRKRGPAGRLAIGWEF